MRGCSHAKRRTVCVEQPVRIMRLCADELHNDSGNPHATRTCAWRHHSCLFKASLSCAACRTCHGDVHRTLLVMAHALVLTCRLTMLHPGPCALSIGRCVEHRTDARCSPRAPLIATASQNVRGRANALRATAMQSTSATTSQMPR